MRLDPDATLSPGTIAAIEDFLLPPVADPPPMEGALQRFALGIANESERDVCARAIIQSSSLRLKLVALRRDAPAFVERQTMVAQRIDRLVAEGRSIDGLQELGRTLPELRTAWEAAAALRMDEAIASLVATLSGPLMETGAEEDLRSLAHSAFIAADRLSRPMIKARMLSMLAVFASRRGDSTEARRLWSERLAIAQSEGEHAIAADALLDLAGQAFEDRHDDECLAFADQAEPVARLAGRPDIVATVWTHRANVALRRGEVDLAAEHAQTALRTLIGTDGLDMGLFVRVVSVRVLLACEWPLTALKEAAAVLAFSTEGGRKSHAGLALGLMGNALSTLGEFEIAERCLVLSLRIHRELSNRHVEQAEQSLTDLRMAGSLPAREVPMHSDWSVEASEILSLVTEVREKSGAER